MPSLPSEGLCWLHDLDLAYMRQIGRYLGRAVEPDREMKKAATSVAALKRRIAKELWLVRF